MPSSDLRGLDDCGPLAVQYLELSAVERDILLEATRLDNMGAHATSKQIREGIQKRHDVGRRRVYRHLDSLLESGLLERERYDGSTYQHEVPDKSRQVLAAGHELLGEVLDE